MNFIREENSASKTHCQWIRDYTEGRDGVRPSLEWLLCSMNNSAGSTDNNPDILSVAFKISFRQILRIRIGKWVPIQKLILLFVCFLSAQLNYVLDLNFPVIFAIIFT